MDTILSLVLSYSDNPCIAKYISKTLSSNSILSEAIINQIKSVPITFSEIYSIVDNIEKYIILNITYNKPSIFSMSYYVSFYLQKIVDGSEYKGVEIDKIECTFIYNLKRLRLFRKCATYYTTGVYYMPRSPQKYSSFGKGQNFSNLDELLYNIEKNLSIKNEHHFDDNTNLVVWNKRFNN